METLADGSAADDSSDFQAEADSGKRQHEPVPDSERPDGPVRGSDQLRRCRAGRGGNPAMGHAESRLQSAGETSLDILFDRRSHQGRLRQALSGFRFRQPLCRRFGAGYRRLAFRDERQPRLYPQIRHPRPGLVDRPRPDSDLGYLGGTPEGDREFQAGKILGTPHPLPGRPVPEYQRQARHGRVRQGALPASGGQAAGNH